MLHDNERAAEGEGEDQQLVVFEESPKCECRDFCLILGLLSNSTSLLIRKSSH